MSTATELDLRAAIRQAVDVTAVVEAALGDLHKVERERAEEGARACVGLLERLKEALGDFYQGAGEVGFGVSAEGRPPVECRGIRYFEGAAGELVASRVRGGRAEFAVVGEDGLLGDWMATPLGEPAMN